MTEWRNRIVEQRLVPIVELKSNPDNWRKHPAAQRGALGDLLREVGVVQGVIFNQRTGRLVDGHLRVELAEKTGQTTVPVTVVDLDENEERLVLATLDPIGAMAEADSDRLDNLLDELNRNEKDALQKLLDDLGKSKPVDTGEGQDHLAKINELRDKWGTDHGQLWQIGPHRLLIGDATSDEDVNHVMDGDLVDCVFTSPPYGVGVDYGDTCDDTFENLRAMLPMLSRIWMAIVRPGGFAVVNFGDIVSAQGIVGTKSPCEYPMALEYWPAFRDDGWLLWSRRVWCKRGSDTGSFQCISSNRASTDWEHIWTWLKPGPSMFSKQTSGQFPSQRGWIDTSHDGPMDIGLDIHGAGMPLGPSLFSISNHSTRNGIVYEPFTGTGTTIVACERLGRRCRATEISPKYVAVTLQRLADMGLSPELLV